MNMIQAAVAKLSKPAEYRGNSSSVGWDGNNDDGDDESTIKIKDRKTWRKLNQQWKDK